MQREPAITPQPSGEKKDIDSSILAHSPTDAIPDHELLRCIGRGSYGEVWLARNMMGTYRAVKILRRKTFEHERPFEREIAGIRKFEPISRSHEGFVDVLQVGRNREAGYFYYVMELGDDQHTGQQINPASYLPKSLATEVSHRGRLPLEECVQLGLSLSKALNHLHEHGLIHRDIKPSNIIFVSGVPKLADIGLVADISEARSYVGTEGFIPPEGPGTPQADVFSLGKVLYEIGTGKDRNDFPALPAQLDEFSNPQGFLELNEVILQACHHDVSKRYRSAKQMHSELLVLESNKSVKRLRLLERRVATFTRVGKLAVLAVVLLLITAGISYQVHRARKHTEQIRQRQVGANVAYGTRAMEEGNLLGSLPLFVNALRLDQGNSTREKTHRLRLSAVLAQCPKQVQMFYQGGRINDAEFSPNGQRVLTAKWFGNAQVWDSTSGQPVSAPFGQSQGLETASFSPDGQLVVTASQDKTACVWDSVSGQQILNLPHPGGVYGAEFSPEGKRIITACEDKKARVWNALTGELILELDKHTGAVTHGAFSPDGHLIITTSQDKAARIWDSVTGKPISPPLEHKSWVYHASFSPDSKRVVTAGFDRKALVWDVSSGRVVLASMNHGDAVRSAEFSPDGRYIVTACWDSSARVWNANTGQPVNPNPILKHKGRVMRASFSPNGHSIVTACTDGTICIWDLAGASVSPSVVRHSFSADGRRVLIITNNWFQVMDAGLRNNLSPHIITRHELQEATFNRSGMFILTISAPMTPSSAMGRELQVWDSSTGKAISSPLPYTNLLTRTCLSDDGRHLVCFSGNMAQMYDVQGWRPVFQPIRHGPSVAQASFSSDGSRFITIGGETVQVWDATTGQALFSPLKHAGKVSHAQFDPEGRRLVTCCADSQLNEHSAQIWNAKTGERTGDPLKHRDGVLYACWSPDGRRVVTASEDFTAIVWQAETGRQLAPALKHEHQVKEVCFSQNGRWIATASLDKTARVWDAETGEPLTPPLRHPSPLSHVKFLAEDSGIIAGNDVGEAWLWNLAEDHRPIGDLTLLSQLLSEDSNDRAVDIMPQTQETLRASWQQLRSQYPADFTTSLDEILSWHQWEAKSSEENRQSFAAYFHLNRLLAIRPEDQTLEERRALAQRKLSKEEKSLLDVKEEFPNLK